MGTVFLVNCDPEEVRIAELQNGKLFNFDMERGQQGFGSIYSGRVTNVIQGMEAAFVDIGEEKNGLLHFRDVIGESYRDIKEGTRLLVQVARPAFGNKGPRLTTRLSLPGRFFVLVVPWDTVGVSRRIESENERARLRSIAEKLRPLDLGLIVRTEAEGATDDELSHDANELLMQCNAIRRSFLMDDKQIGILHKELGVLGRIVRDRLNATTESIIVDDRQYFEACQNIVQQLNPSAINKVIYYSGPRSLFEQYGVEKFLNRALNRSVPLPHGGTIVIEETEALTTIDVNTGKFLGKNRLSDTVVQTNIDAVEEATLQLRLRGIGGVIVIDFIEMEKNRDRIRVLDALEAALKNDRAKTHIVQISPSGLVEITRRREGLSLRQSLKMPCQTCGGEGFLKSPQTSAIEVRRKLKTLLNQNPATSWQIKVHPAVATYVLGLNNSFLSSMELEFQTNIALRVDESAHIHSVQIEPSHGEVTTERPVNIRFPLGIHDCLYPTDSPQFAVYDDVLVKLPSVLGITEHQPRLKEVVVLEILTIGRWFATARLLRHEHKENGI